MRRGALWACPRASREEADNPKLLLQRTSSRLEDKGGIGMEMQIAGYMLRRADRPWMVTAWGNGAGAASFRLREVAERRGLEFKKLWSPPGPSCKFGVGVELPDIEQALDVSQAIGGPEIVGHIFGSSEAIYLLPAHEPEVGPLLPSLKAKLEEIRGAGLWTGEAYLRLVPTEEVLGWAFGPAYSKYIANLPLFSRGINSCYSTTLERQEWYWRWWRPSVACRSTTSALRRLMELGALKGTLNF